MEIVLVGALIIPGKGGKRVFGRVVFVMGLRGVVGVGINEQIMQFRLFQHECLVQKLIINVKVYYKIHH